ncbi:hypothetical protein Adt_10998 [Abeliophyllum distichum]|uniref:Uncharacterized protein n=1 Tax=Abeliophyllum distichum TaxID=126358 RepID=A0ABD1ULK9_9LAMI
MPCLENEKQQETISGESPVDVERVSTPLPIFPSEVERVSIPLLVSPSEVESGNQQEQQIVGNERDKNVIEDHPIDHNPLADYQLARDRERRPYREPQRMSDYTIDYASYQ